MHTSVVDWALLLLLPHPRTAFFTLVLLQSNIFLDFLNLIACTS
jgi:hypothetical protein